MQLLQAAVRVHQQLTAAGHLTIQQRFNVENTIRTLSDYGKFHMEFNHYKILIQLLIIILNYKQYEHY